MEPGVSYFSRSDGCAKAVVECSVAARLPDKAGSGASVLLLSVPERDFRESVTQLCKACEGWDRKRLIG